MRIWKPVFRGRDGKTKQLGKWWIELRDHHQVVRRFPGLKDKTQSRLLGDQIERLVASRVAGQPPSPELTRWLEHVPSKLRDRLVTIGLLDNTRAAASKPLSKHLDDFAASLSAKGNTAQYVAQTQSRAKTVFEGCGFRTWSDIRAERVEHYLADLRASPKTSVPWKPASTGFGRQFVGRFSALRPSDRYCRGYSIVVGSFNSAFVGKG